VEAAGLVPSPSPARAASPRSDNGFSAPPTITLTKYPGSGGNPRFDRRRSCGDQLPGRVPLDGRARPRRRRRSEKETISRSATPAPCASHGRVGDQLRDRRSLVSLAPHTRDPTGASHRKAAIEFSGPYTIWWMPHTSCRRRMGFRSAGCAVCHERGACWTRRSRTETPRVGRGAREERCRPRERPDDGCPLPRIESTFPSNSELV